MDPLTRDEMAAIEAAAREVRAGNSTPAPSTQSMASPSQSAEADRVVMRIASVMIAITIVILAGYTLVYLVGLIWAIVIVTSPGWLTGLYVVGAWIAEALRQRRIDRAAKAAEAAQRAQEAITRASQHHRNRLIRELKSLAEPRLMITLTSSDFERYVLQYYFLVGYETEEVGRVGDGGVDGVLRKNGATSIVQCKRYLQPVGEPEVRDFLGTVTKRRALEGFFITTSTFNTAARSFAEGTPIRLIDGDTLAALINHLKCVDPLTGQPVDLPTFNSDHWSEFSFIRRETREPARRQ